MTISNTEVAETLRDAVAVIELNGWCQGDLGTPDGRVCAMGAIGVALGLVETLPNGTLIWEETSRDYEGETWRKMAATRAALTRRLDTFTVAGWNDKPARTEEEVKKFFLKTADEVEVQ